ncbi:MAG TPA: hypothetical protein DEP25_00725, partial [Candidatus Taylorbacteria bacterium]|nr:hypothetical protein [Candidatus Taylorbacteria bacterium]
SYLWPIAREEGFVGVSRFFIQIAESPVLVQARDALQNLGARSAVADFPAIVPQSFGLPAMFEFTTVNG